jgi:hypothetical protein
VVTEAVDEIVVVEVVEAVVVVVGSNVSESLLRKSSRFVFLFPNVTIAYVHGGTCSTQIMVSFGN